MRRKKVRLTSYFLLLTALFLASFFMLHSEKKVTAQTRETGQLRTLFALTEYAENLTPALEKAAIVSSPPLLTEQLINVVENAVAARLMLEEFSSEDFSDLCRILRQTSDFAQSLGRTVAAGQALTSAERENLRTLADFSARLARQLTFLSGAVLAGEVTLGEATAATEKIPLPALRDELPKLMTALEGMPKLIYDGPFSDSTEDKAESESANAVSKDSAAATAADFLHTTVVQLRSLDEQNTPYPAYCFYLNGRSVKVSKSSGRITELSQAVHVGVVQISDDEGIQAAATFLAQLGYGQLQNVSARDTDGVRTYVFVPTQAGVRLYPDGVKVSVSLADGAVVGLDASAWVLGGRTRRLPAPALSASDALAHVPEGMQSQSAPRLALIPQGKAELLCWELRCRNTAADCLLYVDAQTGAQVDVLLVTENEGTLVTQ
ncbi:MAG: germination protein YpeB [Oscillospiraceae bacterium]|nr:germination protein YpeB [Oscillospiraceae bacterium]